MRAPFTRETYLLVENINILEIEHHRNLVTILSEFLVNYVRTVPFRHGEGGDEKFMPIGCLSDELSNDHMRIRSSLV